jgi:RNA polymerase sigma-70 factor (ECF subfamily)
LSNEEQLVRRAGNDPKAFGELYDRYYPRILGYVYRITGDYSIACDITSETFLKAWIKIGTFKWRGISISSWFFKIASNELNQYFRRKTFTPHTLLDQSLAGLTAFSTGRGGQEPDPSSRLEQLEEYRNMHAILNTLSPDYRKVIALRYFEELSIRQISEILGKREGTIRSLLFRGLGKMKKLIDPPATPGHD